jgi:hypothetical protein
MTNFEDEADAMNNTCQSNPLIAAAIAAETGASE